MDFIQALDTVESKAAKHGFDTERCERIREGTENFSVNAVVVGAFNAGKSALINAFMGRQILGENQLPETAIASELVYSSDEYVECFTDGQAEKITITEAQNIDADRYDYLRWHIRNEALAGITGYTLVDMPGFNSNIQKHNKAILRYAEKASAYVLVIDVTDGSIKQSMVDFLNEIRNYNNNLAIVLTKCDLILPENVAQVAEKVSNSAEFIFGERVPVITTSNADVEAEKKLTGIIRGINREDVCRQRYAPEIKREGETLIKLLEQKKKSANADNGALLEEKDKLERDMKETERQLRRKQSELKEKCGYQKVDEIMSEAESVLIMNAPSLAACAKDKDVFSARVNDILRPVLMNSLRAYEEDTFCSLTESEDGDKDKQNPLLNISSDELRNTTTLFLAALGYATDFIAPWLELAIIALPTLLQMIAPMFKKNPQEEIEEKIRNQVIPGILVQLRPKVAEGLAEVLDRMTEALIEDARENTLALRSGIDEIDRQIKENDEKLTAHLAEIDADIAEIRTAIDSL